MKNKSVFFASVFTVFLVGTSAASARETKAHLHVPWSLVESEMQRVLMRDGSAWQATHPDTTVSVEGFNWMLSGLRFAAQVEMERPALDGRRLAVRAPRLSVRMELGKLSIDQVIEREVQGVIIRARLRASCGPIRLTQEQARIEADIALDWAAAGPMTRLQNFDVAWAPDSWTLEDFTCEGAQGTDELLRAELLKRLKDPASLKPMIAEWLAVEIQRRLHDVLEHLRKPLSIETGEGRMPLRAGMLLPAPTGLVTELIFGEPDPDTVNAPTTPTLEILTRLPKDRPTVLGDASVFEHLLRNEMASRPDVLAVDMKTVSGFQRLLKSRILQLFLWPDLWHYGKSSPFYLRLKTPRDLKLSVGTGGEVRTDVPLQAVVQSKRDGKWWDYLAMKGRTTATIKLSIVDGVLNYQTSFAEPSLEIGYGSAYLSHYRSSGWLPVSTIRGSLEGPQSALSGSLPWPDVDLGVAGRYRAGGLQWLDERTFVIPWGK